MNLKNRFEEIEDIASYKDQLNEEELNWLNRFSEEYITANLKHKGRKLHKKEHHKKAVYKKNNARNKCILSRSKANGSIKYFDDLKRDERLIDSFEDIIIEKIDSEEFE